MTCFDKSLVKEKTACFTGHRFIEVTKILKIQAILENEIFSLINRGVTDFLSGGALGFDMLAAETVLNIKQKFPQINLVMMLPCKDQDIRWKESDKQQYRNILKKAYKVVCLSEYYYDGCMLARNRHLVNNSDFCIAYLTQSYGGTAFTVNYANKTGIEIINIGRLL